MGLGPDLKHADLVALIRDGVAGSGGLWADLGAGEGAFTRVLEEVLGPAATIVAVDRDAGALGRLRREARHPGTTTVLADFAQPLELPMLDGALMANSLHFQANPRTVLALVHGYLRPRGRLVVVEYDVDHGNHWVPYPFSFGTWRRLAVENGFSEPHLVGRHPSRWLGGLYGAVCTRQ